MKPESRQSAGLRCLWARSPRFPTPQLVVAYSDSLHEAMPEEYHRLTVEARGWYEMFGDASDGPWTFWDTVEEVPVPEEADHAAA